MIDWLKFRKIYFTVSAFLLAVSIFSLLSWGLKPGIDFKGGTLVKLSLKKGGKVREAELRKILKIDLVQQSGNKSLVIKTKFLDKKSAEKLRKKINSEFPQLTIDRFETVGPTLGKELLSKTISAAIIAIFGMLAYIAWAFKNLRFGIAAVLALLHDTLVLVGTFSLLGRIYGVEVDALFVTAVLTTMSFSVHDTVVVFNKIREKLKSTKSVQLYSAVNEALEETMVRSINNSLTIVFMLLALILLGGETIHIFLIALLIGTILGTYSSPFVAVPLLLFLWRFRND